MLLFRKEVYSSYSTEKAAQARAILKENGIKYTIRVKDPSGKSMDFSGNRGHFGNYGVNPDFERLYSILVNRKDAENAESLIHRHIR